MNTVFRDHSESSIRSRNIIAAAAGRSRRLRHALNSASLWLLKLGLWLRRAGLPSEAMATLRLSRWAWRTASGISAMRRRPRGGRALARRELDDGRGPDHAA